MEFLKIVVLATIAAIVYGIVHDQVTARVCLEYFTVFHPPVFETDSPTLLALGWGIIATWWRGAFLGLLLALSARLGTRPKIKAADLLRPVLVLLAWMASSAIVAGIVGFVLARFNLIDKPVWVQEKLLPAVQNAFMADWFAHNASYAVATIGGFALCILTYRKRLKFHLRATGALA